LHDAYISRFTQHLNPLTHFLQLFIRFYLESEMLLLNSGFYSKPLSMPIPDYQSLMLPILETVSDEKVYKKDVDSDYFEN
jgi:hypothetical protein